MGTDTPRAPIAIALRRKRGILVNGAVSSEVETFRSVGTSADDAGIPPSAT